MPFLRRRSAAVLLATSFAALLAGCTELKRDPVHAGPVDAVTLAQLYPADAGIGSDPSVLLHDDFEAGWGKWTAPANDTPFLQMKKSAALAHSGTVFLRSTVTREDLETQPYISSKARFLFPVKVDRVYWRFYARFDGTAPKPHHWVRIAAGSESYDSEGKAGIRPAGDEGFQLALDVSNKDELQFYAYWHRMRSGRCNDGSVTPGCTGDQGGTYYYGNVFRPKAQQPLPGDAWVCVEIMAQANTPGSTDGALALWVEDEKVGDYRTGHPVGTWLRARFHEDGCNFTACSEPEPFEGFDFRTDDAVGFRKVLLDAYYQRDTFARKKAAMERAGLTVSDTQVIDYDDVVVATRRIGCRTAPE